MQGTEPAPGLEEFDLGYSMGQELATMREKYRVLCGVLDERDAECGLQQKQTLCPTAGYLWWRMLPVYLVVRFTPASANWEKTEDTP